jgi:hypothetical protein
MGIIDAPTVDSVTGPNALEENNLGPAFALQPGWHVTCFIVHVVGSVNGPSG